METSFVPLTAGNKLISSCLCVYSNSFVIILPIDQCIQFHLPNTENLNLQFSITLVRCSPSECIVCLVRFFFHQFNHVYRSSIAMYKCLTLSTNQWPISSQKWVMRTFLRFAYRFFWNVLQTIVVSYCFSLLFQKLTKLNIFSI